MDTFFGFAAVVITTIVALFSALALQALLLRGVFALMQPATADRRPVRPSLVVGTQLAARAFGHGRV
ncbi:MAG TPA: hypothetical protein VED65_00130 [Candidatus Bathyarchaeia archaeon]|nr:hypothetical protein [Candidatus Bathyarchaeia archaeon]